MTTFAGIPQSSTFVAERNLPLDRKTYCTTTERLWLTTEQRRVGMIVYDITLDVWKRMINEPWTTATTESDWEDFGGGSTWPWDTTFQTLTDWATVNRDLELWAKAQITLWWDRTIANPTNQVAGMTLYLYVDPWSTTRVLTFGSSYTDLPYNPQTISANSPTLFEFLSDGTNLRYKDLRDNEVKHTDYQQVQGSSSTTAGSALARVDAGVGNITEVPLEEVITYESYLPNPQIPTTLDLTQTAGTIYPLFYNITGKGSFWFEAIVIIEAFTDASGIDPRLSIWNNATYNNIVNDYELTNPSLWKEYTLTVIATSKIDISTNPIYLKIETAGTDTVIDAGVFLSLKVV